MPVTMRWLKKKATSSRAERHNKVININASFDRKRYNVQLYKLNWRLSFDRVLDQGFTTRQRWRKTLNCIRILFI